MGRGSKGAPPAKGALIGKGAPPAKGETGASVLASGDHESQVARQKALAKRQKLLSSQTSAALRAEVADRFKAAPCWTLESLMQKLLDGTDSETDSAQIDACHTVRGSLEVEEANTGILLVSLGHKLLALRAMVHKRGACPVREVFALELGRALELCQGSGRSDDVPTAVIADYRVMSPPREVTPSCENKNTIMYTLLRKLLHAFVDKEAGLSFAAVGTSSPTRCTSDSKHLDELFARFVEENKGVLRGELTSDIVRAVKHFLLLDYSCDPAGCSYFVGLLEVVPGLQTLCDRMSFYDELSINTSLGHHPSDPSWIKRAHDNPLYNASSGKQKAMLRQLGMLTSFDVCINNWDRVPLPSVFDNKGNLTNVLYNARDDDTDTKSIVLGVDQAVNLISGGGETEFRERLTRFAKCAIRCKLSSSCQRYTFSSASMSHDIGAVFDQDLRELLGKFGASSLDFILTHQAELEARRLGECIKKRAQETGQQTALAQDVAARVAKATSSATESHEESLKQDAFEESLNKLLEERLAVGEVMDLRFLFTMRLHLFAVTGADISLENLLENFLRQGVAKGFELMLRRESARGVRAQHHEELMWAGVEARVRAAFGDHPSTALDLEANIAACKAFVQGNLDAVRKAFDEAQETHLDAP